MAGSEVILLMAQIDDAPGELLGRVMTQMTELGAKNIQLLSSLAKKGRPGYVLLVDILAEDEPDFAALLVGELGIWGYRVLQSQHKHFDIRRYRTELRLRWTGNEHRVEIGLKRILGGGAFMRVKAEHDELAKICESLSGRCHLPLSVLKAAVETAAGTDEPGPILDVDLRGLLRVIETRREIED